MTADAAHHVVVKQCEIGVGDASHWPLQSSGGAAEPLAVSQVDAMASAFPPFSSLQNRYRLQLDG